MQRIELLEASLEHDTHRVRQFPLFSHNILHWDREDENVNLPTDPS